MRLRRFKFQSKYAEYNFNTTTVNSLKTKCKVTNPSFKKAGRPNLLDETLLKKVKDTAIGTRAAGGIINRKEILSIAKGVVSSYKQSYLEQSQVKPKPSFRNTHF